MKKSTRFTDGQIVFTLLYLFQLFNYGYGSTNEYGVLAAESSSEKENFCIIYFKEFAGLPSSKSQAGFDPLQDDSDIDWCEDHPERDLNKKVSLAAMGNCSVSTQALNIQDRGAIGVFFVVSSGRVGNYNLNDSDAQLVNITVGLISENSAQRLKEMEKNPPISVSIFSPNGTNFDFSLVIMWGIAMFTVSVGSFWSGHIRYAIHCDEMNSLPGTALQSGTGKPGAKANPAEESSLNISPYFVAFFVLCMGLMLVLLYFLYDYLVYVIIAIFVLASIVSVHSCLSPLVLMIPGQFCKYVFRCGNRSCKTDFRQVLLISFAIAISIFWLIIRKEKHAWILQDVLGVAFCIHMLKFIRLPSLKICAVLLILLFFYDIFFVFITPYLTIKGESVMEEVATGGSSSEMKGEGLMEGVGTGSSSAEMLPMVLKVSHFKFDQMTVCYQQFSILGFGDILVPGLLVAYCHGFDLLSGTKRIYFISTVVAYGIGMLVTFMALFLMNMAQPALLYLVPCTLIPPVLIGWCRGELSTLWNGFEGTKAIDASSYPEVQVATTNPPQEVTTEEPALPSLTPYTPQDPANTSEVPQETTEERNYLLR